VVVPGAEVTAADADEILLTPDSPGRRTRRTRVRR
jgi:hypothetical protein